MQAPKSGKDARFRATGPLLHFMLALVMFGK
jgi:hypothetical protein